MDKIIDMNEYRSRHASEQNKQEHRKTPPLGDDAAWLSSHSPMHLTFKTSINRPLDEFSDEEISKLEDIRDKVEDTLNMLTAHYCDPAAVALAAGRFSAMRLFQLEGRTSTVRFFQQCIDTAEDAEDIFPF